MSEITQADWMLAANVMGFDSTEALRRHGHLRALHKQWAERLAAHRATPSQRLDAATVERDAADARRYRYLRDHCSYHQDMTWDQPAEWSIGWEFQQCTPAQAYGSFDKWIDADIERRDAEEAQDAEEDARALATEPHQHGGKS